MWSSSSKKERANPEARDGRQRGIGPERAALVHGGNQETPDGRRDHDARGKAGKSFLDAVVELAAQQVDAGRAERRADKRDGKSLNDFDGHKNPSLFFYHFFRYILLYRMYCLKERLRENTHMWYNIPMCLERRV